MPFENKGSVGRDYIVSVSLTAETTEPASFTTLGAVRGLEYGPEWETADTTARGTASGNSRTALVTYKDNSISLDGLVIINDDFMQQVREHVENPPASMNGQPYAWVRITEPREAGATQTRSYPSLLTSFRLSAPHDGETTYTMETNGQGDPVVTDVPAPV